MHRLTSVIPLRKSKTPPLQKPQGWGIQIHYRSNVPISGKASIEFLESHGLIDDKDRPAKGRAGRRRRVRASHGEIRTATIAFDGERVASLFLVVWIHLFRGNQFIY